MYVLYSDWCRVMIEFNTLYCMVYWYLMNNYTMVVDESNISFLYRTFLLLQLYVLIKFFINGMLSQFEFQSV